MKKLNIHLSIYENAICFTNEAIKCAIRSEEDTSIWKFAIINIVQAIELSIKELLRREHPILIYSNIDKQESTITLSQAVKRLESISNIELTNKEKDEIKKAQNLRNQLIHSTVSFNSQQAKIHFIKVFSFIHFFTSRHLKEAILEELEPDNKEYILESNDVINSLKLKANEYFQKEGIRNTEIHNCPMCATNAFVAKEGENQCYICLYNDEMIECESCNELFFEDDFVDFSNEFEYSNEGKLYQLEENYGYDYSKACVNCASTILDDIQNQRFDNEMYLDLLHDSL